MPLSVFPHSFLLQCLQNELRTHLPRFLIDPEQHGALPAGIGNLACACCTHEECCWSEEPLLTCSELWSYRDGAEHLDEQHVSSAPLSGQPRPHDPALLAALPLHQRLALQPADGPGCQQSRPALPLLGSGSPAEAHGDRVLGGAAGPGAGC